MHKFLNTEWPTHSHSILWEVSWSLLFSIQNHMDTPKEHHCLIYFHGIEIYNWVSFGYISSHGNGSFHPVFYVDVKKEWREHQALLHPTKQGPWATPLSPYEYHCGPALEEGGEPIENYATYLYLNQPCFNHCSQGHGKFSYGHVTLFLLWLCCSRLLVFFFYIFFTMPNFFLLFFQESVQWSCAQEIGSRDNKHTSE